MSEPQVQKEETQKTIVSFVFGLLIGGLLVWAFMGGDNDKKAAVTPTPKDTVTATTTNTESMDEEDGEAEVEAAATLPQGTGALKLPNQKAGMSVPLAGATYPVKEGWVGVRDYSDGRMGPILGVVRFSDAQGLIPSNIILQRPTIAGKEYAVIFFTEDGDRKFNSAADTMVQTDLSTFKAE